MTINPFFTQTEGGIANNKIRRSSIHRRAYYLPFNNRQYQLIPYMAMCEEVVYNVALRCGHINLTRIQLSLVRLVIIARGSSSRD